MYQFSKKINLKLLFIVLFLTAFISGILVSTWDAIYACSSFPGCRESSFFPYPSAKETWSNFIHRCSLSFLILLFLFMRQERPPFKTAFFSFVGFLLFGFLWIFFPEQKYFAFIHFFSGVFYLLFTVFKQPFFKLYLEFSKSGIVTLVLISVLGGYFIGHPLEENFSFSHLLLTLLGVFLLSSGSSQLNQIQEAHLDEKMDRTKNRPLPSKKLHHVLAWIISLSSLFLGMITLGKLSQALLIQGLLAVFSYNFLYTMWWKKHWAYAAIPGAIPGALPILMGHTAASGLALSPAGLFLFFVLFYWQMPHFWILAMKYKKDYAEGGFPTLPVARGNEVTSKQIMSWGLAYLALLFLAPFFLPLGKIYLGLALLTSIYVLRELFIFFKHQDGEKWLRFFLAINFSLIFYLSAMVIDLWSVYPEAYFR